MIPLGHHVAQTWRLLTFLWGYLKHKIYMKLKNISQLKKYIRSRFIDNFSQIFDYVWKSAIFKKNIN